MERPKAVACSGKLQRGGRDDRRPTRFAAPTREAFARASRSGASLILCEARAGVMRVRYSLSGDLAACSKIGNVLLRAHVARGHRTEWHG